MNIIILIKNMNHSLLPEQEKLLKEIGWTGDTINIPSNGLTLNEIKGTLEKINKPRINKSKQTVTKTELVFLSPVPAMMALAAHMKWIIVRAFHNDKREAIEKEIDGKKIVQHVVAKTGWVIV